MTSKTIIVIGGCGMSAQLYGRLLAEQLLTRHPIFVRPARFDDEPDRGEFNDLPIWPVQQFSDDQIEPVSRRQPPFWARDWRKRGKRK